MHSLIELDQRGGGGDRKKMNYGGMPEVKFINFEDGEDMWGKGGGNIKDISGLLDPSTSAFLPPSLSYHSSVILLRYYQYMRTAAHQHSKGSVYSVCRDSAL